MTINDIIDELQREILACEVSQNGSLIPGLMRAIKILEAMQ